MTTVTIAGEQKDLEGVTERWINETINRAKRQGLPVCVRVEVHENGLGLNLTTPGCQGVAGGGRAPTRAERQVIDIWKQQGLNSSDFRGGNLVAFLKQLQRKHL